MDILRHWTTAVLMVILFSCGSGNQTPSSLFSIDLEGNPKSVQQNQSIGISIGNKKQKAIHNVVFSIDGNTIPVKEDKISFDDVKLGAKTIKASISYDDKNVEVTKKINVLSSKTPELYTYTIINEYPHDNKAYTQGLEFHEDTLYEGTGKNGRSFLRKWDYRTGKVFEQVDLDPDYFGEGITILGDKIYQLTWKHGIGFIYDRKSMKKLDNFNYGQSKEGWGLANDGKQIYKSDGTDKIWILDPVTLVEKDHIEIATNKSLFEDTNELEYVNGKIYANVYQKAGVMIIDAKSGAIEGVVNFGGLSNKVTKTENWVDSDNVLNGIAYHPERKTFFVTGKDWDKLFEVQIHKKE